MPAASFDSMSLQFLRFARFGQCCGRVPFVRIRDTSVAIGHGDRCNVGMRCRISRAEMNGERRSSPGRALERELELEGFADRLCDREAEPRAAVLAVRGLFGL